MYSTCAHYARVDEETGGVVLTNDDDRYYCEVFKTPAELEAFIAKLREVANQAFGPEKESEHGLSQADI